MLAAFAADRRARVSALAVVALTLAVWGGVPWGSFQFDDFTNIVRDPATSNLGALVERLSHGLRPLTRLSYATDAHVWGMHAWGFLITNLALHLATALLVLALARRRLDAAGACVAALLFSLQPANAEVIAYVSGRSTGLMTPLLLGGLLLHDRGRCAWALALFALACMAKEVALVFPLLVLLWELTRPDSRRARELVIYAGGAATIAALLLVFANYRALLGYSQDLRPVADNVLANGRAIPITLSLWVRPWALSPDHDFEPAGHLAAAIAGLAALAAVVVAAAWAIRRRHRALALALAWPLIALLPTNSVIAKIDLVTEKPLYLAWVGPSLALGAAVSLLLASRARHIVIGTTVAVLCALGAASSWRASLWRDPMRLWSDAVAKAPDKARCWNNLGTTYLAAERDADAFTAFEHAVRLDPTNAIAAKNLTTARLLCGAPCKAR